MWVSSGLKRAALIFVLLAGLTPDAATAAGLGRSAVVFMYHRFGENAHPTTNTTLEQFEAHLQELKTGGYRVMALPDIVDAIRRGSPLPDRAVAISVDDAYLSVHAQAWPRLRDAGFPFTLFVATGPIDRKLGGYMSWDQIRELRDAGVTIGSQTVNHPHLPFLSDEMLTDELETAQKRFREELGRAPTLIAYPYGEASLAVMQAAQNVGFTAGFGQHSGVIDATDDVFNLPRFALNEKYGTLARVRLAANALALPTTDILPSDPLVAPDNNPPALGFTVPANIKGLEGLACYGSTQGKLALERLGVPGGETRIEVRMDKPLPSGRTRINCTLPDRDGRWRWFGRQFYVK